MPAFTIRPQGELTIYTANDTKSLLLDALTNHPEVQVDLSQVSEMDTAGLQLLILAKQEAARNQVELRFTDHSAAVLDVIELLDVSGFFGDPLVITQAEFSRRSAQ